ncbi:VOC family protein [Kaarinaea lacus]
MGEQFLGANPVLPVNSVKATVRFYEKKLGFKREVLWENPSYAVVKRGNTIIEFGEGRKEHAGSGVCIILVENADVIYREWKSRDIEFVGDFADRDYGSKDFRIKDNNGNMLIVGHALENRKALIQNGNVA